MSFLLINLFLQVFNQMVFIFHSFKGFSDLDLICWFSDLEDFWDDLPVSRLKYNALDDFHFSRSRKSSRRLPFQSSRLPGSRLDFLEVVWTSWKSSGLPGSLLDFLESPFHNRSERFGFSDLKDFWEDLPVSRLKYNALDGFQEVFQTTSISVVWTSWKSSDEVFFHIKWSPSLSL
uniref:Uncharacterized protein n=1 Tax=Brassica oleracea TaxID=3712 RepID=A0A3P6EZL3_BRAOL|nr:unnamed protein product [Brassica oleracea]